MSRIIYGRTVSIDRVDEYLALGWVPDGQGPLHAPHGAYSVWLDWPGPGEPVEPEKLADGGGDREIGGAHG